MGKNGVFWFWNKREAEGKDDCRYISISQTYLVFKPFHMKYMLAHYLGKTYYARAGSTAALPSAAALIWNLAKLMNTCSMFVLVSEKSLITYLCLRFAKQPKVSDKVTLLPSMLMPLTRYLTATGSPATYTIAVCGLSISSAALLWINSADGISC